MDKKIIVFDFDGVIIDSIELMYEQNLMRFPLSTRKEFEDFFTGAFSDQTKYLNEKYQIAEITEEEKEERRAWYTKKKLEETSLYDGVEEMLQELHKEYVLVLNTSASNINCYPILDRLDIKQYFDLILTRDDEMSKVLKFKMIAEQYNTEVTKLLFITDSLGDLIESHELNVPTIAVSYGIHGVQYFDKEKYSNLISVVDSVEELREEIKK